MNTQAINNERHWKLMAIDQIEAIKYYCNWKKQLLNECLLNQIDHDSCLSYSELVQYMSKHYDRNVCTTNTGSNNNSN